MATKEPGAHLDVDGGNGPLPPRYEPNPLLSWVYRRFFDAITPDPEWLSAVRETAARGTVIYALRNLSFLDFLALDHFTKRNGLPQVRFANDLGLWVLEPFGKGWSQALQPRSRDENLRDLRAAVFAGESAALFLKRPPTLLEQPFGRRLGRGLLEGDEYVRELLALQRARLAQGDPRPILLLPQVFVWTRRPDTRERSLVDAVIGSREWPGALRTTGQFLMNYREVQLKTGEPLDLAEFLEREGPARDETLVRRAIYILLRRLERERRVVVGPVVKASDRMVDEIVRTPRVRKVIEELAGEGRAERLIVEARGRAMLREIAATAEPEVVRAVGAAMSQVFSRIYEGLEIDKDGIERIRDASRKGTVVLLPSHKSHIDYLIVSLVLFKAGMQVPLIAAGDNLSFFPLGGIFRRCGAFFIRRKIAGDRLYGAVLDAYVHKMVHQGYSMEFFLEGGRSRTGKLLPPKVGLLSMVVDAAMELPTRPVFFVPISIGYERIVEAKSYVRELGGGEKEGESVTGLLKAARVLVERYGRLNLQVGEIVTIDRIRKDVADTVARESRGGGSDGNGPGSSPRRSFVPRRAIVARLAHQIMYEVNRATAVTGGSLLAMALLSHSGRGISRSALEARCDVLLDSLLRMGARVQPGVVSDRGGVSARVLDEGIALFASAGWLEVHDDEMLAQRALRRRVFPRLRRAGATAAPGDGGPGDGDEVREPVYVVPDDKRLNLDLSKNVIVHFFVPFGLVCTALRASPAAAEHSKGTDGTRPMHPGVPRSILRDRVQWLSRLFKFEFMFRADATFGDIFEETLATLLSDGTLALHDDLVFATPGDGAGVDGARDRVELFASTIASFLEGYRVAARALGALVKGEASSKDLVKRALSRGRRMYLAGELRRREGVSRGVLENAVSAFLDQGYLGKNEGKLVLAPSFATIEAVSAIERRIASYLGPQEGVT